MQKMVRETCLVFPMNMIGVLVLLFISGPGNKACVSGKSQSTTDHHFVFTDSAEASVKIVKDDVEGYFDRATPVDMAIQMKKPLADHRTEVNTSAFIRFIRTEVSDWTSDEKKMIRATLEEAFSIIKKLNPTCLPKISLIKIKTNHYGDHVYYTRGHHICIPENIFTEYNAEVQLPILIHEIFHVISKQNPAYRDSLYALIGFEKLDKEPFIPDPLNKRLLTNPDGVSRLHAIRLGDLPKGEISVLALPLISSNRSDFTTSLPHFFDYLSFDLYPVEKKEGLYIVVTDTLGNTKLETALTTHFFTKIRDNTRYIIHPEEIMADNFMLAALAVHRNDYQRFSPKGKELIEQIIRITRETDFTR